MSRSLRWTLAALALPVIAYGATSAATDPPAPYHIVKQWKPGGEGKPNRDSGRAPRDPALQLSRRQVLPYDPGQDSAHPRDEEGPQHGDFSPSAICG